MIACAARLGNYVAGSAFRSAAAAQQLEWLLTAAQTLAMQLHGSSRVAPGPPRSPEQQRTLASLLLSVCTSIHSFDVRLPRLQNCTQVRAAGYRQGPGPGLSESRSRVQDQVQLHPKLKPSPGLWVRTLLGVQAVRTQWLRRLHRMMTHVWTPDFRP